MSPKVARDLINIIMTRYERGATIVTSNRTPGDWTEFFADIPAVITFIDRMMHGYIVEVKGESYRLHQSRMRH